MKQFGRSLEVDHWGIINDYKGGMSLIDLSGKYQIDRAKIVRRLKGEGVRIRVEDNRLIHGRTLVSEPVPERKRTCAGCGNPFEVKHNLKAERCNDCSKLRIKTDYIPPAPKITPSCQVICIRDQECPTPTTCRKYGCSWR